MDEIEIRRLQELVDAVFLTCAALGAHPRQGAVANGRMRAGGFPSGTTWRPRLVPRGWSPELLGTESEMFIPYMSPFMSNFLPVYPGIGSPGLVHSGVGPVSSGIPMGFGISPSPMSYGSYGSYMTPGIYGYRPVPYGGVGLLHAGYEGSVSGGIGPSFGFNPMMPGMGSPWMPGMGPSPWTPGMIPSNGAMPGMPMQPAWSPVPPMQSPGVPSI